MRLGGLLGKGGEGAVYEVPDHPELVAKVYHRPISLDKAKKIEAMALARSDNLLRYTAWPLQLLRNSSNEPCGLLMPRVTGHKDIHTLYSPRSRKVEFPTADWRFLLRVAANTARAFATIHSAGCVIGDVNHGSVTVANDARVKLIDCDSFQVTAGGSRFLCEVGVPTFTPPELQGQAFRGVVRSPNHDNFGLSILIFLLLFMGRHPFAGRFLGRGDMGIEKAIAEYRFAYGINRGSAQMEPPPNVPALNAASSEIAQLFERAFSRQGSIAGRPTPTEWISAIESVEKQIARCAANTSHYYIKNLGKCPWCAVEAATGAILFNVAVYQGRTTTTFDINVVWRQITAVQTPGPLPPLPSSHSIGLIQPSSAAVAAGRTYNGLKIGLTIAVVIALCIAAPAGIIWWLIGGGILGKIIWTKRGNGPENAAFSNKLRTAEAQYRQMTNRWEIEAGDVKFVNKMKELNSAKSELLNLSTVRQRRYQDLERARQQQQLRRYLEQFTIDAAKIPGIGVDRTAMLESYGIDTAWDVTDSNVMRVPGFGPALTKKLMSWRQSLERSFRFNSAQGVDPRDIAALDQELANRRRALENKLTMGAGELSQLKTQIVAQRSALRQQVEDAFRAYVQAQADEKAANG